jgi:hypothetical protein
MLSVQGEQFNYAPLQCKDYLMRLPAKDVNKFRSLEGLELMDLHLSFGMQLRNALIWKAPHHDLKQYRKELELAGYRCSTIPDEMSGAAVRMLHDWVQGIEIPE